MFTKLLGINITILANTLHSAPNTPESSYILLKIQKFLAHALLFLKNGGPLGPLSALICSNF